MWVWKGECTLVISSTLSAQDEKCCTTAEYLHSCTLMLLQLFLLIPKLSEFSRNYLEYKYQFHLLIMCNWFNTCSIWICFFFFLMISFLFGHMSDQSVTTNKHLNYLLWWPRWKKIFLLRLITKKYLYDADSFFLHADDVVIWCDSCSRFKKEKIRRLASVTQHRGPVSLRQPTWRNPGGQAMHDSIHWKRVWTHVYSSR